MFFLQNLTSIFVYFRTPSTTLLCIAQSDLHPGLVHKCPRGLLRHVVSDHFHAGFLGESGGKVGPHLHPKNLDGLERKDAKVIGVRVVSIP